MEETHKVLVPAMQQAISAYNAIAASDEFKELERLRSRARSDEAAALRDAREVEAAKWQGEMARKDAELAKLRAQLDGRNI
jgi:ribosomal protein S9